MNEFKKFYVWGMNAKFYMGIYFTALTLFVGVVTAIFGGSSIGLFTLLQMLTVCIVIGFSQAIILPASVDFSKGIFFGRSIIWLIFSAAVTVGTSILFNWFEGMPAYCSWLMGALMVAGEIAMLVGACLEQEADTKRLNDSLKSYQKG